MLKIAVSVLCIITFILSSGCGNNPAKDAKFPSKELIFIIPAAPGGGNDLTVRELIPGMKKSLGMDVLPENKPGAKGSIAANEIMNGKPNEHKLYFNSQTLLLMPYGGMPDVKLEKFQPVAQVVEDTAAVIVRADAKYNSLTEFIQYAKTRESKVEVAHNGIGSLWHLAAIQFSKAAGIDFKYIAYTTGGRQMLNALVDGEVDVCVVSPSESKPLIDSGKIKVLAIMNEKRYAGAPDIPTCMELGVNAVFPIWRGVFTTVGTDEPTLDLLDQALKDAVGTEEFKSFTRNNGLQIQFRDHKQFKEFVYGQRELYANLMEHIDR